MRAQWVLGLTLPLAGAQNLRVGRTLLQGNKAVAPPLTQLSRSTDRADLFQSVLQALAAGAARRERTGQPRVLSREAIEGGDRCLRQP